MFLFALVLFVPTQAQDKDEVLFEVKLSKKSLGINERLSVEFSMNRDGDNFQPPDFEGFRVVMGPTQSISSMWVNGVRSFSKSYSYILAPTARGTFTIKQATIVIDGETYKSLPEKVTVTAAVDKPSDEKTVDDIASENLHLVAEVSKTDPYLNEPVSVVYKLYVSPAINVNDFRPLDNPKYNNFWSQDLPLTRYTVENTTYQGKPYRYVILKRVVLYPQKSGKLEIEPLSLDVTLDVPTDKRDFFGRRTYRQTNMTVSAGRRTINVKALPLAGRPESFNGAVGKFDFFVSTSKEVLNASESLQAKVSVKGKGNLKLFQLPEPSLPSALEVYEPEFDENIRTTLTGMQGEVSNSYTIVPAYRGKYPIPGISFTYFDPELEKYITQSSEEITINVLEGPQRESPTKEATTTRRQAVTVEAGSQFNFIKLKPNLQEIGYKFFFGSTGFYLWLLSPVLLIPIAVLFGKKREAIAKDIEGSKVKKANKLARKYLSTAKKALGNKEAFYVAMEKALHNYLKAKLKIETSEFAKEKIAALLKEKGSDSVTINGFIGLIQNCEMARYSPFSNVQMQQDYENASDVISSLDKQL
ncbi:BatD family protein [Lentiprolixibacter aurantiacus]|uniref:BatD family protein n=1 Tax=Lentiprolixibacter aurantiacus TaxID=2993939 RepID=A0AAE3MJP8_9FLAO|nr:BatD family protein [Lentiprolixibacter aurantiacus]MCX2718372.1 BatD family protein [Lentiprolixibacter aurantiacus]